jgi:hypothetical protein
MTLQTNKLSVYFKSFRQLGWTHVAPYLVYQFQLRSGILKRRTPPGTYGDAAKKAGQLKLPVFPLPNLGYFRALLSEQREELLAEVQEITEGRVRLFGGELHPLELTPPGDLAHWTYYTSSQFNGQDIKYIWEPGRFGWATVLARGYLCNQNEDLARCFWTLSEKFFRANPPNIGPHWASGQEVALRMIALVYSAGIFWHSPHTTPARIETLTGAVAAHATRILPTLSYARAQNNNHLISEAVGLYTAAAVLPDHPDAEKWKEEGWRWLHHAIQTQVAPDGSYIQHSTNYHRLMLQAVMFAKRVAAEQFDHFPEESCRRLAAASRWLLAMLDKSSGGVPTWAVTMGRISCPLQRSPFLIFVRLPRLLARLFWMSIRFLLAQAMR